MNVEGQKAADVAYVLARLVMNSTSLAICRERLEIPRPPMIKTAGLSSPDPALVEAERASASAIVGLQFLASGINGCLQTQAVEMELRRSSCEWVRDRRQGKCVTHAQEGAVIARGRYVRKREREVQLYIKR